MTNAQLVRIEAGDTGVFHRDVSSGDGSSTEFYVLAAPVIADSQIVKVGGTARTEVGSAPGATEYTFDDATGAVVFGAAPGAGTDNIVLTYKSCYIEEAAIEEACRLVGLTASSAAEAGPTAALLRAASMVCRWIASRLSSAYDVSLDGQSFSRSQMAEAFAKRADELLERAANNSSSSSPLVSNPTTVIDGYNLDEVTNRDVLSTSRNARRRYYGQEDRYP